MGRFFPFFKHYPGTNLHEIDLDYVLQESDAAYQQTAELQAWADEHKAEYEELADKVDGLVNHLVDVIVPWDSSVEYPIYSIVEYQGTNYIAVQDVPVGAMITNTDYWRPANTVIEQINAIGINTQDLMDNRWYVTPEMFGGAGDGETNDTIAVRAAIESATETGLTVLMKGKYLIDNIHITVDALKVFCPGEIIYSGNDCALTISGWYNTVVINKLTSAAGGIKLVPNGKSVYMLNLKVKVLDAVTYGVRLQDTAQIGILYNKIECGRVRTDPDTGICFDFVSSWFIGETDLTVNLMDKGLWALHAVCTSNDGINAIRTHLFGMEGVKNCIYLENVQTSIFEGLRFAETVDTLGGMFLQMVGACYSNRFVSPAMCRITAVDVSELSSTEIRYNFIDVPMRNAAGRIIALGAKCNGLGLKMISGYNSGCTIGANDSYDFYTENFNGIRPTQFVIAKAKTETDVVRIHLDDSYAWDGINRIQIIMNGNNYRCQVYNAADELVYDLSTVSANGLYELVFNRSTDTKQSVAVTVPTLLGTKGNLTV